jgi:hypothetical protein
MRKLLLILTTLLLLFCAVPSRASIANVYIASAAAGSDTGADRSNTHGKGVETFVYIAPEARDRWANFLRRVDAREAHRHIVVP